MLVVAKINTTCEGGSSKVKSNALKALVLSIWTSSIIYTLYLDVIGDSFTLSIISLIWSTPVFDAASISYISLFKLKLLQISQFKQGLPFVLSKQLIAFANIFAVLVLPVPLGPENIYAWEILLLIMLSFSKVIILFCPTISSNVLGRYFLYKTL